MQEIFKDIPDYNGIYQISNFGNVKSLKRNKEIILNPSLNTYGYYHVSLHKNGKRKIHLVHKLVAIVFLNHNESGFNNVVNHKNFIRTDNNLSNLEIVSFRENTNKKHLKSSSKYVGVSWCKRENKWRSIISINKKQKSLGYYINEYDAHLAYQNYLQNYTSHTLSK